jgi:tetratricopeptide (TPR) repeat protein
LRGFARGQLQDFAAAETDFREALRRNPNDDATYAILVNRGVFCTRQSKFEEAAAHLQRAITLKPQRYQAYLNLARAHQQRCHLAEAAAALDQAVAVAERALAAGQLEPAAVALPYQNRARFRERNRPDAALADLERAVHVEAASPRSRSLAESHTERSRLLFQRKQYAAAVQACELALLAQPEHAPAKRWRAEAHLALGQYLEARQSFDAYLQAPGPERDRQELAEVYRGRGLTHTKLSNYARAIDDYNHSLDLQPDSFTHAYRGWVYLLVFKKPAMAQHDFEEALTLNRRNSHARSGLGLVHAIQGHVPEARADAEQALRDGPEDVPLLVNLAHIYAQLAGHVDVKDPRNWTGRALNQENALRLLRRAVNLTPAPERAKFWQETVRKDGDLRRRLHSHPDFAQLDNAYSRSTR